MAKVYMMIDDEHNYLCRINPCTSIICHANKPLILILPHKNGTILPYHEEQIVQV